jgi:hypothetical protein
MLDGALIRCVFQADLTRRDHVLGADEDADATAGPATEPPPSAGLDLRFNAVLGEPAGMGCSAFRRIVEGNRLALLIHDRSFKARNLPDQEEQTEADEPDQYDLSD